MKIIIDIGHPGHVHYFRNFYKIMKSRGHDFLFISRDKEVTFSLLDYYDIPYKSRGKGKKSFLGKLFYIIYADYIVFKYAFKFKPHFFLSFGSPYTAHISFILRKPHIAFDDTDHAFFEHLMYVPFTSTIVTPKVYLKNYGKKHIRFNGFMELCSLLPKYFIEDKNILQNAGIGTNERYAIVRFVSWQASHDIGEKGLTLEEKIETVKELNKYGKVIISSESIVPDILKPFVFNAHPAHMHQFLKGASLIVSESLTMAAEAAFLGTPAICISTAQAGTLNEEVRLGLIELYRDSKGLKERADEIFKDKDFKDVFNNKVKSILSDLIDSTALMVWFIENYPESVKIMKENPDYQYNFK